MKKNTIFGHAHSESAHLEESVSVSFFFVVMFSYFDLPATMAIGTIVFEVVGFLS